MLGYAVLAATIVILVFAAITVSGWRIETFRRELEASRGRSER